MVAELKGAGQSPPLTPLLPPVSPVSLTTHTPGLQLPAPYYRPTGKHLWDPDQATQQQLCHQSMTYTKPDSEWTRPSTGGAMETPVVRKLRAGKVLTQGHPKSLVITTPGDLPQSPGLTRSFPGSKAFRGFPPPLGQSCVFCLSARWVSTAAPKSRPWSQPNISSEPSSVLMSFDLGADVFMSQTLSFLSFKCRSQ